MSTKPVVLILAAGLGTRMKSRKAKVLHAVAGRPLILWAIECARAAGADKVVAILGHQHEDVRAVIDARYGAGVVQVALQLEQKGTGHAVLCALPAIDDEPDDRMVVILTGDAPLLRSERVAELVSAASASPAGMALLSTHPSRDVAYGRLVRDAAGKLLRIVEHRDATDAERAIREMNAGFYAVRLGHLRSGVRSLGADNAQGELYLTDLAAHAAGRGGASVIDAPFEEVSGINSRSDLAEVEIVARQRIHEVLMREGVTLASPGQTFVDVDAGPFGKDVWLGPGVAIRGKTSIADGVVIDTGCVVIDSRIGENARIAPYSMLEGAIIGSDVEVGPFAHCRPGTRIDDGARIGNFVETYNTHLMAGVRADHHAYLGHAAIGAGADIGAGTITCDSDGLMTTHKSVIEAGAFIGSGSQLVAPVAIGRDAYVGAGTTVTRDVPRASLALSRVKQVHVEDWANRFRETQGKSGRPRGPRS